LPRESQEGYRGVFELTDVGAAQADPATGRFLHVNSKMCEITGYSEEELLGMTFLEITHPEDRQEDFERFRRMVRGEVPEYSAEKRYVDKDGRVMWVSVNARVLRNEIGQPLRTVAVIQITERKRAEEGLQSQLDPIRTTETDGEGPEEVRILLVEDHASFRQAAAIVFERETEFTVVGQAGSLAEARQMLDGVDVAIIDLGLPDGYGGELIKELRTVNSHVIALVLTASIDRVEIARAAEFGAAGILHKSADMNEVVNAVRRLRAGETLLPLEEVVELLRFAGSQRDQEYEARQAIAQLTSREKEVLQALAEGLDGEEIAQRLRISTKTERNHIASIFAKLGVHSRLQALVFALRYGVVDIPR
jgi:PAS domain S-box-containing protein